MTNNTFNTNNIENKRWIQCQLSSRLSDSSELNPKLTDGIIVVLSGPNPNDAIKYYSTYELYRTCVLVENNSKIFYEAKGKLPYSKKAYLLFDDIFNTIRMYRSEIRGIDFDFCTTLKPELIDKIANAIESLEQSCIWFRVTSCHRRVNSKELYERKKKLLNRISKNTKYSVIDQVSKNYRDVGKMPMNVWQVILRNNEQMEEGTMRTFQEMTQEERDIARTLVNRKYEDCAVDTNYTDEDIARVLQMSPLSVSALKAHVTMRAQGTY